MSKIRYGKFLLEVSLVSIMTAILGSLLMYFLGFLDFLGIFKGIIIALILTGLFIYSLKLHPGKETFLEIIPIVIISASLIELIKTWIPMIPSIITEFSWVGLAVLLSSIYLSDTIVKKYILKKF